MPSQGFAKVDTVGKQIMVYHLEFTVQLCSSGTVATWPALPKKQGLKAFALKCFFHKQLSLDMACARRPTWWTVALFRAHTHRSMIRHLWRSFEASPSYFSNISMHQSIRAFFERLRDSARTKVFYGPMFMQYQMYVVGGMPNDSSMSRYVTWRSCIISTCTASMFSGTTAVFVGPSRISSLSERRPRLN